MPTDDILSSMDTIAELVYEKADIDTRLALHQAYGVFKSIFWVQNFSVPRAQLQQQLPAILAKRKQYPDVTMVHIHEGCTLVRHINNTFIYEEMLGPSFVHPCINSTFLDPVIKHSTSPYYLRHWNITLDYLLQHYEHFTTEDFFHRSFVYDERFLPMIEEKLCNELDYYYVQFERCIIAPETLGLSYHEKDGYYVCKVQRKIRHLENFKETLKSYA